MAVNCQRKDARLTRRVLVLRAVQRRERGVCGFRPADFWGSGVCVGPGRGTYRPKYKKTGPSVKLPAAASWRDTAP